MKPCEDKIKLTPEEEKALNESVFQILVNGLEIINKRFDTITYLDDSDFSCKPIEEKNK